MLSIVLLTCILFIPGFLICRILEYKEHVFVCSLVFSYLNYILMLALVRGFDLSLPMLGVALLVSALVLALLLWIKERVRSGGFAMCSVGVLFSPSVNPLTVGAVLVFILGYQLLFGVYNEFPSDIYQHVNFVNYSFDRMEESAFERQRGLFTGSRAFGSWYVLLAWIAHTTGIKVNALIPLVMVFTSVLFFLGVVALADRVFKTYSFTRRYHQGAIVLTVLFVFAHMGINAFSYFRYYSIAPTIVNFVIYFAGLIYLLNLFEREDSDWRSLFLVLVSVFVAALLHLQEGLFLMTAGFLMGCWWSCKSICQNMNQPFRARLPGIALLGILLLAAASVYLWIRFNYALQPFHHNKLIPFSIQYIGQLFILDPTYQFYRVVTIWGVLVYGLFLLYFRCYVMQPFLVVGMLSPIVTMFNPLFADVFVRLGESSTLWRMAYFVPLHLVAALAVVFLIDSFRQVSKYQSLLAGSCLALLLILLFPSVAGVVVNPFAKTTLAQVQSENSSHHWADLIEYLDENDHHKMGVKRQILTDPVTGYLLDSMTGYKAFQSKFLPSRGYYNNPFSFENYDDLPLSRYENLLIIVNLRIGAQSVTGERTGHWNKHVLRTTDYYSDALLPHLKANPDRFEPLFENDNVYVFKII